MAGGPAAALLPDGRRLHLQHGPIDLVIEATGTPEEVRRAYRQAQEAFAGILPALVRELPRLRRPLGPEPPPLQGPVARRMLAACWPCRAVYVTPMAAVAGSVAAEVLAALVAGRALDRAYVNNGGDIALHLAPGARFVVGLAAGAADPGLSGRVTIAAESGVRGVATSGRGGRSLTLGIADSVTVLASDAAAADVAATLVANAVDLDHPAVRRAPADEVVEGSDLGALPVTVAVGPLEAEAVAAALEAGAACARRFQAQGRILGAVLMLRNHCRVVGEVALTWGEAPEERRERQELGGGATWR